MKYYLILLFVTVSLYSIGQNGYRLEYRGNTESMDSSSVLEVFILKGNSINKRSYEPKQKLNNIEDGHFITNAIHIGSPPDFSYYLKDNQYIKFPTPQAEYQIQVFEKAFINGYNAVRISVNA
nr:hypothetical protein [Bacteroidota bacterium]